MGKRYLVDDNGVVITEIDESEYCQIKNVYKKKDYSKTTNIKMPFFKANIKYYNECCIRYSLFPYLIGFLTYFDNSLVYGNGRPLKGSSLAKKIPLSERTISHQIKQMIDDEILKRMKFSSGTYLVVNPWLCYKGKNLSSNTYEAFKGSKWALNMEVARNVGED